MNLSNLQIRKFYDAADTIAGISAGSGLIGGIYDAITAQHRASDAQNYGIGMYQLQRKDALADWNMQNQYNAPSAIMARYKAAGLNPNLIYGNSGIQSPAVRSSAVQGPVVAPATMGRDVSQSIAKYQNYRLDAAQVDQTKQAVINMQQDNLNKQADLVRKQVENIILQTDPRATVDPYGKSVVDEGEWRKYQIDVESKNDAWQKLITDRHLGQQQIESVRLSNALQAGTNEANIVIAYQKSLQSLIDTAKDKLEQENLKVLQSKMLNDVELQKMDMEMQAGGLNAKSPFYQKILSGFIDAALLYVGRSTPQSKK